MGLPGQFLYSLLEVSSRERRTTNRYPLACAVTTRRSGKRSKGPECGHGTTVNMSSGGVLLKTDEDYLPGQRVEVSIAWPILLDQRCSLKVTVHGRVVRVKDGLTAVEIQKYQFKTAGRAAFAANA